MTPVGYNVQYTNTKFQINYCYCSRGVILCINVNLSLLELLLLCVASIALRGIKRRCSIGTCTCTKYVRYDVIVLRAKAIQYYNIMIVLFYMYLRKMRSKLPNQLVILIKKKLNENILYYMFNALQCYFLMAKSILIISSNTLSSDLCDGLLLVSFECT